MAASSDGHGPYPAPPLPDPHHFALMAWDDAPATAGELRDMRAAGLNIAGFCREKDLPKIRAAGLACFLKPEALDQVDWQAPERPAGLNSVLKHAADVTRRHPEVLGVFLSDEPQTADLPALRAAAELLETGPSPVTPYINLFPFRSHPVDWYTNYADYA
jgi:hypothetical protein